ncbi:MAG TPA: helix-turn-helix domain-containing protein [Trebonia sp.]|nr:helix-turn-helix domain-containing protein [Trebonia sp.]
MEVMEIQADADPADALAAVAALRRLADQLEDVAVERAMRSGWGWPLVAEALGVTRQAVHKKHAQRLIAAGVELRRR